MHDTKEHFLCDSNYRKTHQEKTGRKYTPQLTVVQLEVGFWGGGSECLYTFLSIKVTNLRPQIQVCKRPNFIFIYYKLISALSPNLLVMKTLQSIQRVLCQIKVCSVQLPLADGHTVPIRKAAPSGRCSPTPARVPRQGTSSVLPLPAPRAGCLDAGNSLHSS